MQYDPVSQIRSAQTCLGIEFGSTRIKSVLIDRSYNVLATGSFCWENRLEDGLWTYHLDDAIRGLQESYADLRKNVETVYGVCLQKIGCIGISGMMHGYLPLDQNGKQLSRFLTWRNTNTAEASEALTGLFQFNVPLRWSISQLYQAILNREPHVEKISYLTTLAGFMHFLLSGQRVLGIDDASGMFPIDAATKNYDQAMLDSFSELVAPYGFPWKLRDILPQVRAAGEDAGFLTESGARLLDPTGNLQSGIPMAPPEGDAATGMTATNAVASGTGNVSAGTSIFAMVVLEKNLSRLYRDIDIVSTPAGKPVAMVHCNNGTSELDSWMRLFTRAAELAGAPADTGTLYSAFFRESLLVDADCGGTLFYNFQSGEPVVGLRQGRPLFVRASDSDLTLAKFMRTQLYSILASLSIGMQILEKEQVRIDRLTGHGGLFKTPGVMQRYMAAALNAPIHVMENAGEGGPYGMALLAAYRMSRSQVPLEDFLQHEVFRNAAGTSVAPDPDDRQGFMRWLARFRAGLAVEEAAIRSV